MSRLHLPTPYAPSALDRESATNGATPRATFLRRAADAMNSIAVYHKKVLTTKCQNIQALVAGGSSLVQPWPFYWRTGENTIGVRVHLGLVDTDYGAASDPSADVAIHLAADDSIVVETRVHHNARNPPADPSETPNRATQHTVDLKGLSADTEYYSTFRVNDGGRLLYLTVHELAEWHADDSVPGVVDPTKFLDGGPIYDEHVEDLLGAGDLHWRHGGCHYLTWNPDYDVAVPVTASSYTNVIDGTSTTYSSSTPGETIASQYHGTATTPAAGPAVKIAVKATRTSGLGSLSVRLFDGTNQIELTGVTTGGVGDWYVGTANIPSQVAKWDIQAKCSTGEFDLLGVCVFAYEA